MSPMQTFAPSLAYRNAIAWPRPLAPPVINTRCVIGVSLRYVWEFTFFFIGVRAAVQNPLTVSAGAGGRSFLKLCGARDGGAQASHRCAEGACFRKLLPPAPGTQCLGYRLRTYTSEAPAAPPSPDELHPGHRPISEPERSRTTPSAGNHRH